MKRFLLQIFILLLCLINYSEAQTNFIFTSAGASGNIGPSQSQLDSAYALTNLFNQVKSISGIQTWTVPASGTYRIKACGAQGGSQIPIKFGGKGSGMQGDFYLTAGTVLKILVGQQGSSAYGCYGGGGGSFVADTLNTPLIVAGGGGGAGGVMGGNGIDASTSINGTAGFAGGNGGVNGQGGSASNTNGGSGGGFYSDGNGVFYMPQCSTSVGSAFINGGSGGQFDFWMPGGFGGGGSGWDGNGNGGGGGGYSGGGTSGISFSAGGGGGSFNSGTNQLNIYAENSGDGKVIITQIISTGLSALNKTQKINLFPNPNNGNFYVEVPDVKDADIIIRNMLGEVIQTKKAQAFNSISINEVNQGIYTLEVSVKGTTLCTKSFVKQ